MRLVAGVQAGVVDVEGVGVLHDEFAAAQQARAGTCLVAVLVLDLVEAQRQVLVRGVQVLDQQGEHFLVRGGQQVVVALAVLEPEDALAVLGPAVGGLVGLLGQQRREVDFLGADGGHFLADDRLHLAQHAQPQRQPGVDARGGAADVPGADQQPVAGHLGVGGIFAQGAQEQLGESKDHWVSIRFWEGAGQAAKLNRSNRGDRHKSLGTNLPSARTQKSHAITDGSPWPSPAGHPVMAWLCGPSTAKSLAVSPWCCPQGRLHPRLVLPGKHVPMRHG